MTKFLAACGILFFLFSCQKETTPSPVQTWETKSDMTAEVLTWEIIPPNEKTTDAEKEFANDLNNLLNTIEEESDEWTNNTKN